MACMDLFSLTPFRLSQILILIFAEVLGLYGLIVALILNTKVSSAENPC